MTRVTEEPRILIVGAGLAGLAAAVVLGRHGLPVRVLEASERSGGRAGGDVVDDCVVDRGFQVLFPAYPHLRQVLDPADLDLKPFNRGAWLRDADGRWRSLVDPRQNPAALADLVGAPWWRAGDALALLRLTWKSLRASGRDPGYRPAGDTATLLREAGVSRELTEAFFLPFFGGIQLDDDLGGRAEDTLHYWHMLAGGGAALPARGMQTLPDRLATLAQADIIHGAQVVDWLVTRGRVTGARTADGRKWTAQAVLLATEPSSWSHLLPELPRPPGRAACSLHILTDVPLIPGRRLLLGRAADPFRVACPVSAAAPSYAPSGQHQTVFQLRTRLQGTDHEQLMQQLVASLAPGRPIQPRLLAAHEDRHAQHVLPVGGLPLPAEPRPGLFLATDAQVRSSIDGAIAAGMNAAHRLEEALRTLAP